MLKEYTHTISRLCLFIACILSSHVRAQRDSTDLTFSGTKINPYQEEFDSSGKVYFSGYIDAYYAHYLDSASTTGIEKFPTIAPRNQQFGLNMVQVSARYQSQAFRGTVTLFGGDCPQTSWSSHLNFIQEANAGFRIAKSIWLDAGFFRTHIGLESIQPRENMTMSLATTTYFEPYFLSGAKLTWQVNNTLAIQANVFNSFNQFIETNKNKAFGLSVAYNPGEHHSITFSSITCDESPDTVQISKQRFYNNLCYSYKTHRWIIGFEANYGWQIHSGLQDSSRTAQVWSSLLALKYRLHPKWALYARGEIYRDPDEVLTGPVENGHHELVGLDIQGITAGIEYKPIANSFVRIESRYLQTRKEEDIFYYHQRSRNQREEFIAGIGLWF